MTMLEKVAKASYETGMLPGAYDHLPPEAKAMMRRRMKAVLRAIRKPDETMLEAANHMTGHSLEDDYIAQEWRAMIDAILKEGASDG